MMLSTPRISTKNLTLARGIFVGELSEVKLSRIWDDACDEGLTLVSHKTNREVVYGYHREQRDAEGELLYIVLTPVAMGDYGLPPIQLFND
jgi:hypothetical protein